jgi:hypothetical protein
MTQLRDEFASRLRASTARDVDGAFSIQLEEATVGFEVRDGHLEVVTERQNVHAVLPRWLVTRLIMGYYSGNDVLTMGPIPDNRTNGKTPDNRDRDMKPLELSDPAAAILRAFFPKLWPTATPDPDVWPWVLGKEHPLYNGYVKTPEMKAKIDALQFPWFGR